MKQLTEEQMTMYSRKLSDQSSLLKSSLGKLTIRDINSLEWLEQDCKDTISLLHEILSIIYSDEID